MPNPSEMQRVEEEALSEKLAILRNQLSHGMYRDKHTKETILRQIREVERELGVESSPYNSNSF